jgi:polysaccharide deacetylase family protein (PEP-CTERM system associated)
VAVCFTFDVEEHDRIEAAVGFDCPQLLRDNYARRMETCTRWLLETLSQANARATFFFVGQIARTHPRLIRDTAAAGHEVACHSWDHQRVHRQSPAEFRADLRRAKATLEDAAGMEVVGYRAPTFSVTRATAWAIDILVEEGMRYDSSVFPVRHDRYGVPDAPRFPFRVAGAQHTLLELPLATLGIGRFNLPAAGGGYFRLFPPAIMHAAVRQIERQSDGVPVLYFHPWEFDPSQPRLPLSPLNRMRTYFGIPGSRARFQRLLARYGSTRMIDVARGMESRESQLPIFNLCGGRQLNFSLKD